MVDQLNTAILLLSKSDLSSVDGESHIYSLSMHGRSAIYYNSLTIIIVLISHAGVTLALMILV